jgi:putative oxidoreductase
MNRSFARGTSWCLQLLVAIILLQTLFFKFSAAPESVYIFTQVGAEPWGRIGSGVAELIAAVLLLIPATAVFGAVMSLGVITGAVISHLAILGIEVMDDGGLLFALAIIIWIASAIIVVLRRSELPVLGARFAQARQARV